MVLYTGFPVHISKEESHRRPICTQHGRVARIIAPIL